MEAGRDFEAGKIQYIGDNYHLLVSENDGNDNETALAIGLVDKLMTKQEIFIWLKNMEMRKKIKKKEGRRG